MFSNAKIGDKVFDYLLQQWGTVVMIRLDINWYPLLVEFDKRGVIGYTFDGKRDIKDKVQALFWDEVESIIPPKKPLPKLEVDTPVLVWDSENDDKQKRYFSHFDSDGNINCFACGATNWSRNGDTTAWANWELAE